MPLSQVDTDEVKTCIIGAGVASNTHSLSSSTSPTQQVLGVSHEVNTSTSSDQVTISIVIGSGVASQQVLGLLPLHGGLV